MARKRRFITKRVRSSDVSQLFGHSFALRCRAPPHTLRAKCRESITK